MGKTLFILELPEPAVRKALAPPLKKHKNKKLYSRKTKHKKILRDPGGFFCARQADGSGGARAGGVAHEIAGRVMKRLELITFEMLDISNVKARSLRHITAQQSCAYGFAAGVCLRIRQSISKLNCSNAGNGASLRAEAGFLPFCAEYAGVEAARSPIRLDRP